MKKTNKREDEMEAEIHSKRRYDSSDTKKRLLKAAVDVFSKKGYDAATTREIAKAAKVNLSLIPRYFENKLGLFFAIIREFHNHIAKEPPYPPAESLKEELKQFFHYRMDFTHKHRKILRLSVSRAIVDPKVRKELNELTRPGSFWLVPRLKKLKEEGKIRANTNPEKAALMISCMTFGAGMFTDMALDMDADYVRSVLDSAVDTLCQGLCTE